MIIHSRITAVDLGCSQVQLRYLFFAPVLGAGQGPLHLKHRRGFHRDSPNQACVARSRVYSFAAVPADVFFLGKLQSNRTEQAAAHNQNRDTAQAKPAAAPACACLVWNLW
jgi:hypothetical protein